MESSSIVRTSLIPCKCWTLGVSIPLPPACEASALPFELGARSEQIKLHFICKNRRHVLQWALTWRTIQWMRVVFDHHIALRTHTSSKSSSLIVRLSKEPPLNALQAVMLRPYHSLLLSTMLSTKAPFLFADSPIIDGSLSWLQLWIACSHLTAEESNNNF